MKYMLVSSYGDISIEDKVTLKDGIFSEDKELPFKLNEIQLPVKKIVYKVRHIIVTDYGVGIRLFEIKNPKFFFKNIQEKQEPFFSITRFKKKN